MDAILEAFAALAVAHPKVAGALVALGAVLTLLGAICAQVDTAALAAAGWPRLAEAVRLGAHVGAFALRLRGKKS